MVPTMGRKDGRGFFFVVQQPWMGHGSLASVSSFSGGKAGGSCCSSATVQAFQIKWSWSYETVETELAALPIPHLDTRGLNKQSNSTLYALY